MSYKDWGFLWSFSTLPRKCLYSFNSANIAPSYIFFCRYFSFVSLVTSFRKEIHRHQSFKMQHVLNIKLPYKLLFNCKTGYFIYEKIMFEEVMSIVQVKFTVGITYGSFLMCMCDENSVISVVNLGCPPLHFFCTSVQSIIVYMCLLYWT
jgi:hypothetical protein